MKRLLAIFVSSFCILHSALSVPVIFPMQHYLGQTPLNRQITAAPDHPFLEVGTNVVTGQPVSKMPTNGIAVLDLVPDGYTITVDGINSSFHINVTNFNGTLNATDISDRGLTIYSGIIPLPGVSQIIAGNNITVSPSNGKGVVTVNSTGGSGGSATNAYQSQVNGGAGLTIATNLATFVYTFALNAALQNWSAVTPTAWSNGFYAIFGSAAFTASTAYDAAGAAAAKVAINNGLSTGQTLFNPTNAAIGVNVIEAGAVGGSTDDTAKLQALLNQGGKILFPPGRYTTTGLYVTNNSDISGNGATMELKAGTTNVGVFNWVAGVTNVIIKNIRLYGLDNTAVSSWSSRNASSNRMGINLYINSVGSRVENVVASGFVKGIAVFGDQDGLNVFRQGDVIVDGCECYSNFFGLYPASSTSDTTHSVEYFTPTHMRLHDNTVNFYVGGGNIGVLGNELLEGYIGVMVDGTAQNAAHSYIEANHINHNSGFGILVVNLSGQTEEIEGNDILSTGTGNSISISNSAGVSVFHNQFGAASGVTIGFSGIASSSKGPNFVYDNIYSGVWGVDFRVFDWNNFSDLVMDNTTNAHHWGNYSATVQGNADPYFADPMRTNMAPFNAGTFTNLTAAKLVGTIPQGLVPFALTNQWQGSLEIDGPISNAGPVSFNAAITNFVPVYWKFAAAGSGKTNIVFFDSTGKAVTNDLATFIASIVASGGSQTPWGSDIDGNGHNLSRLGTLGRTNAGPGIGTLEVLTTNFFPYVAIQLTASKSTGVGSPAYVADAFVAVSNILAPAISATNLAARGNFSLSDQSASPLPVVIATATYNGAYGGAGVVLSGFTNGTGAQNYLQAGTLVGTSLGDSANSNFVFAAANGTEFYVQKTADFVYNAVTKVLGVSHATNADVATFVSTPILTNQVYETNVVVSTNNWNWPGPTNNLDFARGTLQRYHPTDTTGLNITNVLNFPASGVGSVVLWIENTNTSALNVKLPSVCETTNGLGGLTVSVNASNRLQILMDVSPLSTNALFGDQQIIK